VFISVAIRRTCKNGNINSEYRLFNTNTYGTQWMNQKYKP